MHVNFKSCFFLFFSFFNVTEVADITHALSKLTEPAPVPIHKLSVTNMVHSAKKKIRKHRGVDESPLNNEVLNTILLVSELPVHTRFLKNIVPACTDTFGL